MFSRTVAFLLTVAVFSSITSAKDRKQPVLPDYALQARTVAVIGDPDQRTSLLNPDDQRQALNNVEQALSKWGRLSLTLTLQEADLIIVVRKGRQAGPLVGGDPNNRPVIYQPADNGARIGLQRGTPPSGRSLPADPAPAGTTGMQAGTTDDILEVYRGHDEYPLDNAAVWRYSGKDALNAPSVYAVEEFRKAVDASENARKDPKTPKK